MARDGSQRVPLRGTQSDAQEHGSSTALQPRLQAGLMPTREKQIPRDADPESGTRPGKPHIWVCPGSRAQRGCGRAQLFMGSPSPGPERGGRVTSSGKGSFYK